MNKHNPKRSWLAGLAALLLLGLVSGLLLWNKPHQQAADVKAEAISPDSLYRAFTTDEAAANARFLNKVLEVAGTPAELSINTDGKQVAIFPAAGDPFGGVQCTFLDSSVRLRPGEAIKAKGFCHGFTTVVLLSECVLE